MQQSHTQNAFDNPIYDGDMETASRELPENSHYSDIPENNIDTYSEYTEEGYLDVTPASEINSNTVSTFYNAGLESPTNLHTNLVDQESDL